MEKNKVYLKYKSFSTGGGYLSDGPYAERDPDYASYEFISLSDKDCGIYGEPIDVDFELIPNMKLYLLVVRYTTGDSFGTSYGNACFEGVYQTLDEVNVVADLINKDTSKYRKYIENKKRTEYVRIPWDGYFERLEDIEIHEFTLNADVGNIKIYKH